MTAAEPFLTSNSCQNAHRIAALESALRETLFIAMAYGPEGKSPPDEEAVFARARGVLGLPATGNVGHLLAPLPRMTAPPDLVARLALLKSSQTGDQS